MTSILAVPAQYSGAQNPAPSSGASSASGTSSEASAGRGGRVAWFDLLRAFALVRVVFYHVVGWVWLPAVFPSMGIMFALAGSLMAVSLDRTPGGHWKVLGKRVRRLLPPLWLMGAILVPVMLSQGWSVTETAGTPLTPATAWRWLLPLVDPPGSAAGANWVLPLWYIRTYLWFVLLSPAFLWMFRRWPRRVLAVPLVTLLLVGTETVELSGTTTDIVLSLATFGGCWLLGFAHHDGLIRRMSWRVVAPAGLALLAAGLAWAFTHQTATTGWNLDDIPVADGLYGMGAVLLLTRVQPNVAWLTRRRVLSRLVSLVNARAMTIYLWGNFAIFLATPLADSWSVTARFDVPGIVGQLEQFALAWVVLGVAVLALGWIEDVAAGRRVRLLPWG